MTERLINNYKETIPFTITSLVFLFLFVYSSLPTNVGFITFGLIGILGFSIMVLTRISDNSQVNNALYSAIFISGFLIAAMFFSPIIFQRIDNAEYFDSKLTYVENGELPFQTPIDGTELRVVDKDLAQSIMDKSNPFGSNKAIYSIHLGNYEGELYWIGAAIFDGIITNDQNNRVIGFILVDITDPTEDPIIINQEFEIDVNLIFNHDQRRNVWYEDINYLPGENSYFSYNDDANRMELIVPYAIQDGAFLGKTSQYGGMVTSDMHRDGGVLIYGPNGDLIGNYGEDEREEMPEHAKIQVYSENWLERQIGYWGRSIVADHDVRWSTALPWVRSERLLGVDDDVRVVINPDNFNPLQYILLDSTDSTNQILRGAIKANESGLFYYNWEEYKFIDTNSAHDHVEETITNIRQTSTHGYKALLPILYPIRDNVTDLSDYAYVMPLQLGESRFGGIAITNPADKTGTQTIVEFVESEERANVSETVEIAVERFITLVDSDNGTVPVDDTEMTGNFTLSDKRNYNKAGNTIYVMEGNFTGLQNNSIRVTFSQEYITDEEQWLEVVFADVNDVMEIKITVVDNVYYTSNIIL